MIIQVLGPGCRRCEALHHTTLTAVAELGLDATVEKVTDYTQMARMGVIGTPALALGDRVLVTGRVPSVEKVRELLAAAVA